MEESETLISEREIPRLLAEYQMVAVTSIISNQIDQGFEILCRSKELIEAAISQEALVSPELIILVEHTFSLYYHQTDDTEKELAALKRTISLFKNYIKSLTNTLVSKPSHRIFKARILLKLHLQLLAAHCKVENFDDALAQARLALRRSSSIIHNSLRACQEHILRHKLISQSPVSATQAKNQQYVLLESPHYQLFHNLVGKTMPTLLFLDEKTNSAGKSLYTVPNVNFEDITKMQPWNFETLVKGPEIMEELESELMMEKIVIHVACYYFLANLLKKVRKDELLIESSIMMKKAWRICSQFLSEDHSFYISIAKVCKIPKSPISRVRSSSRMKTPVKILKSEPRSFSTNKIKSAKKLNESCRDLSTKSESKRTSSKRKLRGK